MSAHFSFTCPSCSFSVGAWEDAHPFITDDKGKRHYFNHPRDQEIILAVASQCGFAAGKSNAEIMKLASSRMGCEGDGICLECGKIFQALAVDPPSCPSCKSGNTAWIMDLPGKTCPKCKSAQFAVGEMGAIS